MMTINESRICLWQRIFVILVWLTLLWYAATAHASGVVKAADNLLWSPLTILLCTAGWFLSWSSEWGIDYNKQGKCFANFVKDHYPRIVISLVSTFAIYAMLPELGSAVGYEIKFGNLGAFLCGLAADFIVQRIRGLIPKKDPTPPDGDAK